MAVSGSQIGNDEREEGEGVWGRRGVRVDWKKISTAMYKASMGRERDVIFTCIPKLSK
jgi:hypothetical protein